MKRKSSADKIVIHLSFSILFHSKVSISIFHKYTSQDKPIEEENKVYTAILTNLLGSNKYFAKRFQNEAIKKNFLKTNHFPTQWIHGNSKTSELHTNALCSFNLYHIPTG